VRSERGEITQMSAKLAEALVLRRGGPLAEFADAGVSDTERTQLDELILVASPLSRQRRRRTVKSKK
jgi:hypothetical protein